MMQFDRLMTITVGNSRKSVNWNPEQLLWSEMVARLGNFTRGTETMAEYRAMPKGQQDDLKDIGGFVAGTLSGKRRLNHAVKNREIVTLDLDNIIAGQTNAVLQKLDSLGVGFCVYSTRKHAPEAPRLRVLFPLSRPCTADEYEPLARKMAEFVGIGMCDPTTFEVARLMYYPSCSADSQVVYTYADKPFSDVDGVLSLYPDWHDVSQWAGLTAPKMPRGAKQADPTEKSGVVGAFCRVYDVHKAIAELIPDCYTSAGDGRYTYANGSTTGGAVVYENGKFLFSHHATDPASGKLCNAFDLVRLHLFGDKDDNAKPDTPANKLPSFVAMCNYAVQNQNVANLMNQERYQTAVNAFSQVFGGTEQSTTSGDTTAENTTADTSWMQLLSVKPETGKPTNSIDNIVIILENDPMLKGRMAFDEFSNRVILTGSVPWDLMNEHRDWKDTDDAGLRHYLEKVYGITGKERIFDGTTICHQRHKFNSVGLFLGGLPEWDGIPRLDTLFIDYLGATDNIYVRDVTRKSFCAAIDKALQPGGKYDTMPILVGNQGIGKSTLLRLMGRDWFNDSLNCFEGKEASEMIQGSWLVELGELNAMNKSEVNQVKQFLSKTDDIFREPYGRRTGRYPRRCVFFGTTNDYEFLRDPTGSRRFWVVDCGITKPTKRVFGDLENEVLQIWAEALVYWRNREPLYLEKPESAELALQAQEEHAVHSVKEGIIKEFLEKEIPVDWEKRDLSFRRSYWAGTFQGQEVDTKPRDRVCALEIWCEALNGSINSIRRQDAMEINAILAKIDGWERSKNGIRTGRDYGLQKGFLKKK